MDDTGANACRAAIRETFGEQRAGKPITVTTVIPQSIAFDSPRGYICRHGVTYWVDLPR